MILAPQPSMKTPVAAAPCICLPTPTGMDNHATAAAVLHEKNVIDSFRTSHFALFVQRFIYISPLEK
ncbi:MAG: hypothetical protein GC190_05820 [Alphaproteobacteria bacterium]|nr:hypothetical protein [Alphaproteobacteria bacterium]